MEAVTDFILGGSKIIVDDDCSHEIAPWKKSYDQPRQHIKKQRHYFANKGPSIQRYGFSSGHVWMWQLDYKEIWVPKNWYFRTAVLEKTVRVPWTARRSNQSMLKEISPEYIHWNDWYWSWNSNTLATSCKEPTHLKRPWCWERLQAGGEGDYRGWDGWMASLTQWTWVWASSGDGDGQGCLACCSPWSRKESDKTEQLNNSN